MSLDDSEYDTAKSIATLIKASSTSKNLLLPPPMSWADVKRLLDVDEDENVEPADDTDDVLADAIVDAARSLVHTERVGNIEVSVDVGASLAALFDRNAPQSKELKPRLLLAWHLTNDTASLAGMLTCCHWARDTTLGTDRFTQTFCDRIANLPRLSSSTTLFIDVVASRGRPQGVGALLVLSAYQLVMRSRSLQVLCTIAVTEAGKRMFEQLGFNTYRFREDGGTSTFCWIKAGELQAANIDRRLRLHREMPKYCWRKGATARTSSRKYPRC